MHDSLVVRWLRRALPAHTARTVFDPALQDLRIERAATQAGAPRGSARRRRALDAALVLLLWLDAWRMVLLHPLDELRPLRVAGGPAGTTRTSLLMHDLRQAARRFVREPAFTAVAVLTLAAGVGANVAVFAIVEAVLLRALPYSGADELAVLQHRDAQTGVTKPFIAVGDFVDLSARQQAFERLAGYGGGQVVLHGETGSTSVRALAACEGLLDVLRVRPVLGRSFTTADGAPGAPPVMMLGHEFWQSSLRGEAGVIGRSLRVGTTWYTVVGIAPPEFRFPPASQTDVILTCSLPAAAPSARQSAWTFSVGRLRSGQDAESATLQLQALSEQLAREYPETNASSRYEAVPLRDALVGSTKTALLLLLGAVGAVLLIACSNVANLQLARTLGRSHEFAVRMALGAGRRRLASMLLTESLLLSGAAAVVGVLLAQWAVHALIALIPESVAVPGLDAVRLNPAVLGFTLAVTVLATLASGAVGIVATWLKAGRLASSRGTSAGRGHRRAAAGLAVAELALALVLLIGAGLITRSFAALLAVDPGFDSGDVATLTVHAPTDRYGTPEQVGEFYRAAFDALAGLPGVGEVGAAVVVPLTGNNWTAPFARADRPPAPGQAPATVGWQSATAGFFRSLDIPLLEGRLFDERDVAGPPSVLISESLARAHFADGDPVGARVVIGSDTAHVVGVVGDIRRAALTDGARAELYFPFDRTAPAQATFFVSLAGSPTAALPSLQQRLRELEPRLVISDASTLDAIARDSIGVTELVLWILGVFSICATALAAIGTYSVMSYTVRRRTREFGIRLAIGANRTQVLWTVLREGVGITGAGVLLGLLGGLLAARLLASLLFGVPPTDLVSVAFAVALLGGAALTATLLPARTAAALDPVRTLRE